MAITKNVPAAYFVILVSTVPSRRKQRVGRRAAKGQAGAGFLLGKLD
jgi:hypothetical protein